MSDLTVFLSCEEILSAQILCSMIADIHDKTDATDIRCVAEDIECILTVASVTDRLPGWLGSVGTTDYLLLLHRIKSVYYYLIDTSDEAQPGIFNNASVMLMKDLFDKLELMIDKDTSEYS